MDWPEVCSPHLEPNRETAGHDEVSALNARARSSGSRWRHRRKSQDGDPEEATDDLKKIEGIGPKISEILTNAGIGTFAKLAASEADKIREILAEAGNRYKMHDPTTWPKQAQLAADGKWDELKTLQDELDGGK